MPSPTLGAPRPARRPSRLLAGAFAAGLVLALVPAGSALAAQPRRAHSAADWEVSQVHRGRVGNVQFGSTDWGLTVDTYLALVAAGNHDRVAKRVIRTVSRNVDKYVQFRRDFFAGAVAKTLLARRVAGRDPSIAGAGSDGGPLNLRAKLRNLVTPSGRVSDSGDQDFSNTVTQSLAVLALTRSGRLPDRVVGYLAGQRCPGGGFRLDLSGNRCGRSGQADVDATAFALQALVRARADDPDVSGRIIARAARYLARQQADNGSFGGAGPTSGANTNSTGLAAQALNAVGRERAVRAAGRWVAGLQLDRRAVHGTPARTDRGALAYDRAGFRAARRDGVTSTTRDSFRRATPQGVAGLVPRPLGRLSAP